MQNYSVFLAGLTNLCGAMLPCNLLLSEIQISSSADIRLLDDHGQTVAELNGFTLQRTSRRVRHLPSQQDTWLYQLQVAS